jgi:SAM-dependent methyltransferase
MSAAAAAAAAAMRKSALPLPRRVIRKLVRGSLLRRTRTILDVGCEDGNLVASLQSRGKRAAGIDDRTGLPALIPNIPELHQRSIAGGFPFPQHYFDLILIRHAKVYAGDLTSPESFIATANLLSSLKPRRRAVVLMQPGDDPTYVDARVAVWRTHLAHFGGEVSVAPYVDGKERYLSLEWLLGRNRDINLTLLTILAPRKAVSRLEWHQQARQAVLRAPAVRAA